MKNMPLLGPSVLVLGVLLSFSLVAHGRDVDPTEDFCSLSAHMSRTPSGLLKNFLSQFIDQLSKYLVTEKDGILYILGGWMRYDYQNTIYKGPSSYPHLNARPSPFSSS